MPFNSSIFLLLFLPAFMLVYYLIPQKARNYWILLCSLVFFAWGAPVFVLVCLASVFVNFLITRSVYKSAGRKKQALMLTAVIMNLLLLFYYKYSNFFVDHINAGLTDIGIEALGWTAIALPLGISFITFHQISYVMDVYREEKPPLRNPLDYALYILMFPRLLAGPIVRYGEIADDIRDRKTHENMDMRLSGVFRFSLGLAKKVMIADVLGMHAHSVFSMPVADLSTGAAWLGLLSFTFQLYVDFSAYSDMAIGLGRMMGFRFPENFNNPYVSGSITEFWRRWHITLSAWLREYLYMPLAVGMRNRGKAGVYIAVLITFTLCGMWHDAGWSFILWGVLQGLLLVADQAFMLKFMKKIGRLPSVLLTFFMVMMGWVLFRVENLQDLPAYYGKLFSADAQWCDTGFTYKTLIILMIAVAFSLAAYFKIVEKWQMKLFDPAKRTGTQVLLIIASMALLIMSMANMTSEGFHPFIYTRF